VPDLSVLAAPVFPRIPTGFPALDALLGGGWPTGVLTELLVSRHGSGELGLLSPALARLTAAGTTTRGTHARWVMLIAPPWIPYAPGLHWQGLALDRVLMVRVRQPPEALWVMDETLRSGACAGVIAWAGTTARFRRQRSPARLRLELLSPSPGTLQIEIFKNGWRGTGAVTVERRF
jgi:hypothetical protein